MNKKILRALIDTKKGILKLPFLSDNQKGEMKELHNSMYKFFRQSSEVPILVYLKILFYVEQYISIVSNTSIQSEPIFETGGVFNSNNIRGEFVHGGVFNPYNIQGEIVHIGNSSNLTPEQVKALRKILNN